MRSQASPVRWVLLGILAALLVAVWKWDPRRSIEPAPEAPEEPDQPLSAAGASAEPSPPAAPRPAAPHEPAQSCEPHASRSCSGGDVFWFDSCGVREERAEACGDRGCQGASCLASSRPDPRCVEVSAYGVCEGDRAVACLNNQVFSVDCAARGFRCVTTREGARCLPRDPRHGCDDGALASCSGDRLHECVDGYWNEIDCSARHATCISDGRGARCSESTAPAVPVVPSELELCNGVDDDHDGQIDEADACRTIPLVAFVPQNAKSTDLETRMAAELEIANTAFAPLKFAWAKHVTVPGDFRSVDFDRIDAIARVLSQQESSVVAKRARGAASSDPASSGLPFYVAVLYAERIRAEPPKAGVSTLPNATCGGVRISDAPSPPYGVIVLADQRTPQSLSHELGHYFGLCHTHEEVARVAAAAPDAPSCKRSGDAICDTAFDPGPEACGEVAPCDFYCAASSARPDAANLMGYYMHCRRTFTSEQLAEVARGVELRRGWFACLDPQDCPCRPGQNLCPAEMSCHPHGGIAQPWSCELDGPSLPGAPCQNSSQCALDGICLSVDTGSAGRCVRPCEKSGDCTCENVGLPFQVCSQDLGAR
jgi:hypothetical protein